MEHEASGTLAQFGDEGVAHRGRDARGVSRTWAPVPVGWHVLPAQAGASPHCSRLLSQTCPGAGVQVVMGADAGEFGAVAPESHDDGTSFTAGAVGRPGDDELALLGSDDPAAADEEVTDVWPEVDFDAADPWGRVNGVRRVKAAGKAEHAPAPAAADLRTALQLVEDCVRRFFSPACLV